MQTAILLSALWGICAAIVGVVYAVVLPGELIPGLRSWYAWLSRWHDAGGWRMVLASPLGGCAKCFSGQLALWSSSIITPWSTQPESIAVHILAACCAVLSAAAIAHAYRWLMNRI